MNLKKMLKLSLSVLFLLGVITTCEKEENEPQGNNETSKEVKLADLSGDELKAVIDDKIATAQEYEAELSDLFTMGITFSDNQVLTIETEPLEEGSFSFTTPPNSAVLTLFF